MRLPLSFSDLTDALISLTGASEQIVGLNMWRQMQGGDTLGTIDAELAKEVPYAPSKQTGNPDSLWSKLHFGIMMPNFHRMKSVASDAELTGWHFSDQEASRYFRFVKDLKQHVETHYAITRGIDEVIVQLPEQEKQLAEVMRATAKKLHLKDTQSADFLSELADYLPAKPTALFEALKQLGQQPNPALRRYGSFFSCAFEALPEPALLRPVFSRLLKEASRQAAPDGSLQSGNQLIVRMLQAYYADKRNLPFEQMGLDARAKAYFKGKGLFDRTMDYLQELSNCPVRVSCDGKVGNVSASDIFALFSSWYRKPSVTEMLTPNYTGAATGAVEQFKLFLDAVKIRTQGRIDLAGGIEADELTVMREDDALLRRTGRIAMAMDASGNKPDAQMQMDSAIVLSFAKALWPEAQRKKAWGSAERYVPRLERGFESFRQDVATLLFATALNVEHHTAYLPGRGEERQAHIATIKKMAGHVIGADTSDMLLSMLSSTESKAALSYIKGDAMFLEHDQQLHCPHAASGIHFISTYLGLEKPVPVPIPEAEIIKGLALKHLAREGKLLIDYQEDGNAIHCEIAVPPTAAARITYHEKAVKDADGIIYPAYLSVRWERKTITIPVIGRTSYDPMGATGSAHAGEVIGFGCSMHHSSLQYALAMAAALGADREGMNRLKDSFMGINPELHQRQALADFQVEQVASAFETGKAITYRDWMNRHDVAAATADHEHTQDFSAMGGYTPSYRKAFASLAMSYPDLYPAGNETARTLSPRASFYDGRDVSLPRQKTADIMPSSHR